MEQKEKKHTLQQRILPELALDRLLPSLTAGLISGILTILFSISFAAMIFTGDLSICLSNGIGLALFGAFTMSVTVALTSSFAGAVAIPQECPAAILALAAATVVASLPETAGKEEIFITVAAVIVVTTMLTGVFFYIIGSLKLSSFIRFIPYPVIGGFLAGTGWLLIQGGVGVITGAPLNMGHWDYLAQPVVLIKWLPALGYAFFMLFIRRKFSHFLVMPALIIFAVALFYFALFLSNTSLPEASAHGWFLGPFPEGSLWKPLHYEQFTQVNWTVLFSEAGNIGTILLLSLISLLLSASGIELATKHDIDLNHELKSSGLGNMVAGIFAGPVGYLSLSLSALSHKIGSTSRLVGLTSAVVCVVVLLFGAPLLSYFPKPALGSLILFIGLAFLTEWVFDAWFKMPRTDYFLVLLILIFVTTLGFLVGIGAGICAAGVIFIMEYSRINVVKHELSGINYHSNVDRSVRDGRLLIQKGEQVYILKLQGFIFFGTASNLLAKVRKRANSLKKHAIRFIVLDFRLVSGIDSSALSSLVRMRYLAESQSIFLIYTNLSPTMLSQFKKGDVFESDTHCVLHFADIDHAVEWCEDRILSDEPESTCRPGETLRGQLREAFPSLERFTCFTKYLERKEVDEGFTLIHQGDGPQGLYFIDSGRVTVQIENKQGKPVRLRTMGAGTVVGELGLYLGLKATATVIAESPSIIYRLPVQALQKMEDENPDIASAFHRLIIRISGERLINTNNSLRALLD